MDYLATYQSWLNSSELTNDEKNELKALDDKQIKERFYTDLEFGTAGMRGVIELGTNRMNNFAVKRATKGLAEYVKTLGKEAMEKGIIISYDTRRCSSSFAIEVAKVLSANGVNAFLFENVRPVPLCSFAIRYLHATGAVMITASHNPKVYNGYKVYGDDGAQMSPEGTDVVVKFIKETPYFGIKTAPLNISAKDIKGLDNVKLDDHITVIGKTIDNAYFEAIEKLSLLPKELANSDIFKNIKVVYTPIHGSGYMPVTTILKRRGINTFVVEEQANPDTEFSTVRVPNPEEADTLKLGVELANKINADIVFGTDPDADRIGVAIRTEKGDFTLLNGNQTGVLMANYIMTREKEMGTLPKNGALVKTIVTTELAKKIADSFGVTTINVLTGFKFIGEKIKEWEKSHEYTYVYGFEESYGSLVGTHARDKDAVVASMIIAEMYCYYYSQGIPLIKVLNDIYKKYGYFVEKSTSVAYQGIDGMDKMKAIMLKLRQTKFDTVDGVKVLAISDFVDSITTNADGTTEKITLPKTNALKLFLEHDDWICVRPSGTEPKLKFYVATSNKDKNIATQQAEKYLAFMKDLAK